MDTNEVYLYLQGMDKRYTKDHAAMMAAYGRDKGLTPFAEFSPMLFSNKKTGAYQIQFKDHYSLVHRWAQDRGGYRRTWKRMPSATPGDITVEVRIISNRDYAIVLTACQYGANREEEMAAYEHIATAICTASDYNDKRNTGKSQEWFALKRATEAALIDCFGKEPAQARQIYASVGRPQLELEDATAALFGEPRKQEALPAPPVIEAELVTAPTSNTPPEPESFFDEAADARLIAQQVADAEDEAEASAAQSKTSLLDDSPFILAVEFGCFDTKQKGKLHLGFMAEGEKWPSVRYWKGRDALLEAAPWIGQVATKDELGQENKRFDCRMKVYYTTDDKGYKTATRFEQAEAQR